MGRRSCISRLAGRIRRSSGATTAICSDGNSTRATRWRRPSLSVLTAGSSTATRLTIGSESWAALVEARATTAMRSSISASQRRNPAPEGRGPGGTRVMGPMKNPAPHVHIALAALMIEEPH